MLAQVPAVLRVGASALERRGDDPRNQHATSTPRHYWDMMSRCDADVYAIAQPWH